MRRANRVEPVDAGGEAGDITRATVTTTTRMEFVRRVEVVPMVSLASLAVSTTESNGYMSLEIIFSFLHFAF